MLTDEPVSKMKSIVCAPSLAAMANIGEVAGAPATRSTSFPKRMGLVRRGAMRVACYTALYLAICTMACSFLPVLHSRGATYRFLVVGFDYKALIQLEYQTAKTCV